MERNGVRSLDEENRRNKLPEFRFSKLCGRNLVSVLFGTEKQGK